MNKNFSLQRLFLKALNNKSSQYVQSCNKALFTSSSFSINHSNQNKNLLNISKNFQTIGDRFMSTEANKNPHISSETTLVTSVYRCSVNNPVSYFNLR